VIRNLTAVLLAASASLHAADPPTAPAPVPLGCTGSASLGTFQLSIRPFSQGSPLPLKSVAEVPAGSRLIWDPAHLRLPPSNSAEVTAVLVPEGDASLITLEPRKASEKTEWQLLQKPLVIALVYGPQGLSEGKVQALVTRNQDLLRQLADYAEQSSEVESLVQELADAEQSRAGADAAVKGVSAQYGVSAQKLNATPGSDQQAALLLKALLPASNNYDPLATQSTQMQQTGGLAASVAGLFFGNPAALAAGGLALFGNLKTVIFPNTEFRSAFAQTADKGNLALCTKNMTPKARVRTAYLWAYRVPQLKEPAVSLTGTPNIPLGTKSSLQLKLAKGALPKELALVRDWKLIPAGDTVGVPVTATVTPAGAVEVDLTKTKLTAGDYQLAATWDWQSLPVSGNLHLHSEGDFTHTVLAAGQHDKLMEGRGKVAVEFSGPDFEFLESVVMTASGPDAKPVEVPFKLPLGKRGGPQNLVALTLDTAKQGAYQLTFMQSDGVSHKVPVEILPPNPKFTNLPLHLNTGEPKISIALTGSGIDRIEAVTSDAGEISGDGDGDEWSGEIKLKDSAKVGQKFGLTLKVKGLDNPVTMAHAFEILGPRPKILSARKSLAGALGIDLADDELAAGSVTGLVLKVDHLAESTRPHLELRCEGGDKSQSLTPAPAGPGALYVSIDPGAVGYPGCRLTATVVVDPEGRSDAFALGRVIRVPRLDKFALTSEKIGDASYAGTVDGNDLDVIEKAGWDPDHGLPVDAIPTPIPGPHPYQTLRLVLPWPAPSPHAPLYIWLRGENKGRRTAVTY
jgi:hypothetical protein